MTKDEALRLALEALQCWSKSLPDYVEDLDRQAITAIKDALEAKDEPVAWMVYTQEGQSAFVTDNPAVIHPSQRALPLYTTPQRTWVGLTKEDMPDSENPMFDHEYFIAGMVFAAKILEEKNT